MMQGRQNKKSHAMGAMVLCIFGWCCSDKPSHPDRMRSQNLENNSAVKTLDDELRNCETTYEELKNMWELRKLEYFPPLQRPLQRLE
jgi:hypothetical protein